MSPHQKGSTSKKGRVSNKESSRNVKSKRCKKTKTDGTELKLTATEKRWGKDLARRHNLPKSEADKLATILLRAKSHDEVDDALLKANKIIHGYGIGPIRGKWVDHYYQDIVALYINRGDTYDDTILFDTEKHKFKLTTMGDFVERRRDVL